MEYFSQAKKYRHELHQIPERGLQEFKTSTYIFNTLEEMGYTPVRILETGVLAFKQGTQKDSTIAFRADMDGLPITEESHLAFKSLHENMMHACGHDFHMAILLGLAAYLKSIETKENILFLFQPAEESPGGAKPIIELGVLQQYHVKEIYGLHMWPDLEQGHIGVKPGPLMAMPGELEIEIKGIGGHGAMPDQTIDPIVIAAQLISSLQSIVSRNVAPVEHAVVTIGYIHGGTKHNVISDHVQLGGTIRAFEQDVYDTIKRRIKKICEGFANTFETEINVKITDFYKAVNNDKVLTEQFIQALDGHVTIVKPSMTGEDFSFYQEVVPGVFFFLGSRNQSKGYTFPLHNSRFNADDSLVEKGIETYIRLLRYKNVIE
ncbi:MAG: amidohydrolase [Tissierellales bacterium]|nr:amidohydrolase [Tissierellales bacterium]MBN2828210.1 amidohydrolase [Tissierellales bacterium]